MYLSLSILWLVLSKLLLSHLKTTIESTLEIVLMFLTIQHAKLTVYAEVFWADF